jgi:LuxR family maltose regulon positive regulatory protein
MLVPRMNAQAQLALLTWIRGDVTEAVDIANSAVAAFNEVDMSYAAQAFSAYLALAGTSIDRDELQDANGWLALAERTAIEPHAILALACLRALSEAALGRFDVGLAGLRDATERVSGRPVPVATKDRVRLIQVDLLRRSGGHLDALAQLQSVSDPSTAAAVRAGLRLGLAQGGDVAPERDWPAPATRRDRLQHAVLATLWADARGDESTALHHLEDALVAAAPGALRSVFLDERTTMVRLMSQRIEQGTREPEFAVDLLNRMSDSPLPLRLPRSPIVIPLTERERAMLRYLATSLSNAEISNELYITVNTVKTHQRTIYRKLAVRGRRDAVRRGRELGLI